MMRSLYSGVAGLRTHQTKMDVIGNNIANVNTMGFKSASVLFRDVLYQTSANATGATATTGGTNVSQIGLGAKMSSIQTSITSSGAAQSTDNPYDLMLNGPQFFIVSRNGQNCFTKVGAFEVDGSGPLVTSNGYQVMGWQVDPDNPNSVRRDTVSALKPEAEENKVSNPEMTTKSYLTGNVDLTDPDLTSVDGGTLSLSMYDSLGYSYNAKFQLKQDEGVDDHSIYTLTLTSLKDSNNVELLGEDDKSTTDVVEGGYLATMTKLDKEGVTQGTSGLSVKVKFNADNGSFEYVGDEIIPETTDANGKIDKSKWTSDILLNIQPNPNAKDADGNPIERGDVFFGTQTEKVKTADGEHEVPKGIRMDFSHLTMYESSGNSTAKIVRGATDSTGSGRAMGKLNDVSIDKSGKMYGVYTNGETKLLGQIAVAAFANPMAMEAIGDSMYKTTQNSGVFDGIGVSVDEGGGSMTQGVLEMSNVDLSSEFTEMITTQRGFQANSRIITTSDSMLEELVNLKR